MELAKSINALGKSNDGFTMRLTGDKNSSFLRMRDSTLDNEKNIGSKDGSMQIVVPDGDLTSYRQED